MIGVDFKELFRVRFSVSRETTDRLSHYEDLIRKWNPTINLVAKSTLDEFWSRHFLDSAEVFSVANVKSGRWADLGSGGGFPGLVVAILAAELAPEISVTCVESDIRKCEFIRTVSRAVTVPVAVISRRIEDAPRQNAQVISARALAPLPRLIGYVERHLADGGVAVLHKGENWRQEVKTALESWRFSVEKHVNPGHPNSAILRIGDISRG